jgi:CheY-like chemotaxis protein
MFPFIQVIEPNVHFIPKIGGGQAKEDQRTAAAEKRRSLQHGARVMIVEDEPILAENLKEILEHHGHHVMLIVASGEEAIKNFKSVQPDLILMDIRLRGVIDGIQTALVIQQTIAMVPIIFLTAYSEQSFPHLRAVNAENSAYLMKPYSPEDLIVLIDKILGRSERPV